MLVCQVLWQKHFLCREVFHRISPFLRRSFIKGSVLYTHTHTHTHARMHTYTLPLSRPHTHTPHPGPTHTYRHASIYDPDSKCVCCCGCDHTTHGNHPHRCMLSTQEQSIWWVKQRNVVMNLLTCTYSSVPCIVFITNDPYWRNCLVLVYSPFLLTIKLFTTSL